MAIARQLLAVSVGLLSFGLAPLVADAQNVTTASYRLLEPSDVSRNIRDYVQPNIQDISLTLQTGQYNAKAGEKISKEFGLGYKLSGNGQMLYKQPNLIRLDGRLIGMKAEYVMVGFTQHIHVGFFTQSQNHAHAPGKVATLLDLGLINDFYLTYTNAEYEGVQTVDGAKCAVFKLTYQPDMKDTSFRLVWIDTTDRLVRRREEHNQDGSLRAIYSYLKPVQVAGAWIPTEVDATNAEGEFVGQTFIRNARLNTGVSDAEFH